MLTRLEIGRRLAEFESGGHQPRSRTKNLKHTTILDRIRRDVHVFELSFRNIIWLAVASLIFPWGLSLQGSENVVDILHDDGHLLRCRGVQFRN